MKRKLFAFVLLLLLSVMLTTPALAWTEYGVIYDESEQLWSAELERLGTEVLPSLTEKYDIDMRVDILVSVGGYGGDLSAAAAGIYEDYGYGGVYGGNGVTLTLLVSEDEDGVALVDWLPYAAGESWELTTNGTWNICRNSDTWLSEEAWSGGIEQDIEALVGAVTDMAEGLESFVLAGGVHSTIWSPVTESLVAEEAQPSTDADTTAQPTTEPTDEPEPTPDVTAEPTNEPIDEPTNEPTIESTTEPTVAPSATDVSDLVDELLADEDIADDSDRLGDILIRVAVILLLPLAVAGIVILVLTSKMRSVAAATSAERYIKGRLELTGRRDEYTHSTERREKVKSDSSD